MEHPPTTTSTAQRFGWHGWTMQLPSRWNPVKIEGDDRQGSVLFADLHRPRLGMRWKSAGKKFDAETWAKRALRDEVGQLAADEARQTNGGWLYNDPEPPGRDVFVMHTRESNRVLQLVYHAHRRERILEESILPTLRDGQSEWAVFDLRCQLSVRMKLISHRLNAGDLLLTFKRGGEVLNIRQIALAHIALQRMPTEKWLLQMVSNHYAFDGEVFRRRRRFVWMARIPPVLFSRVIHDTQRDRLALITASSREILDAAELS
jgi:hypothetical protein